MFFYPYFAYFKYILTIFHVKIQLFVTLKSEQDPDLDAQRNKELDPDPH